MKKTYFEHSDRYKNFENGKISSDFSLFVKIAKDLLLFLIMFIPNLLLMFLFLFFNTEKSKLYFSKIFIEPFKLFKDISDWFFEAKITAYLIISFFLLFLMQIFYLNSTEYIYLLMTHPDHLFSSNFYSLITSVFLHADIVHLLSNSLALLIFGRIVEKQFGKYVLLIFLSSGIIANIVSHVVSVMTNDLFYSLGASGAIAGLIIFAILLEPFYLTSIFIIPLPIFILGWILIMLDLIGLTNPSQTNHYAHFGGYGALLILFFFLELRHRKKILIGFSINLAMLLIFYLLIKIIGITEIIGKISLF